MFHIFREVPKTEAEKAAEAKDQAKKEQTEAVKKGRSGLLGYFQSLTDKEKKKGNIEFSLGNLFSCLCFTSEDNAYGIVIDRFMNGKVQEVKVDMSISQSAKVVVTKVKSDIHEN